MRGGPCRWLTNTISRIPLVIARSRRRRGNPWPAVSPHRNRRDGRDRRAVDCFTAFAMTKEGVAGYRRPPPASRACVPSPYTSPPAAPSRRTTSSASTLRHCEEPQATWQSTARRQPPSQPPRWAGPSGRGLLHCVRNDEGGCGRVSKATARVPRLCACPIHLSPCNIVAPDHLLRLHPSSLRGAAGDVAIHGPYLTSTTTDAMGRNRQAMDCFTPFAMTKGKVWHHTGGRHQPPQ